MVDQGARNGHALALSAGELIRLVVHARFQAHICQGFLGARNPRRGRRAVVDQRQLHVVQRRGPGQQVEGLKDEADFLVADARQLVVIQLADQLAVQPVACPWTAYRGSRSGSSAWTCPSRRGP